MSDGDLRGLVGEWEDINGAKGDFLRRQAIATTISFQLEVKAPQILVIFFQYTSAPRARGRTRRLDHPPPGDRRTSSLE